MSQHKSPRVTIADVAAKAGVASSTVSYVLNAARTRVPISESTKNKVLRAVEESGYQPNAAARALVTRRSGHIGFLLSDTIADGWSNAMFSRVVCGVEDACREENYSLTIRRYNLSNIDSFVFPRGVSERSVDGLVLCGYVEAAVVRRFGEFGIPCVCIGDNVEVSGMIPTIASDFVDGLHQATAYAAGLGHTRIAFHHDNTRRSREIGDLLIRRTNESPNTAHCRIHAMGFPGGQGNYDDAKPLMDYWSSCSKEDRPSLIICTDQTAMMFLCELSRRGLQCPRDVSIISGCDSRLSVLATPPLTSIHYDMEGYGLTAAKLLLGHLIRKEPLGQEQSRVEPCTLVIRRSVGPAENV